MTHLRKRMLEELQRDALGTSNATTGLVPGAISLLSAPVYPLAAMLSDRWDERCGLAALGLGLQCAGCIGLALFPHSLLRVTALVLMASGAAVFLSPFWRLPTRFLNGTSAAAGIALISAIGSTGGFIGPSITTCRPSKNRSAVVFLQCDGQTGSYAAAEMSCEQLTSSSDTLRLGDGRGQPGKDA